MLRRVPGLIVSSTWPLGLGGGGTPGQGSPPPPPRQHQGPQPGPEEGGRDGGGGVRRNGGGVRTDGGGGVRRCIHTRLLHPQHLDGIWIGQDQCRVPLAPLNEFPEACC